MLFWKEIALLVDLGEGAAGLATVVVGLNMFAGAPTLTLTHCSCHLISQRLLRERNTHAVFFTQNTDL